MNDLVIIILGAVWGLFMLAIGLIFKGIYKKMDTNGQDIKDNTLDIKNVRENYIDRFEKATKERTDNKESVLAVLGDMKLSHEQSRSAMIELIRTVKSKS